MNLDFLVTGTGRCGTTYMARLLTNLGIMCGHESIFNYDGILKANSRLQGKIPIKTSHVSSNDIIENKKIEDWFDASKIKAESSYLAAPFLDSKILQETKIIHVIRNPLDVLSSHIIDVKFFKEDLNDPYQDFVFSAMPDLLSIDNEIERGCYYYLNWNKMIEKKSIAKNYLLHKVEKGCTDELKNFLGIKKDSQIDLNKKINSWNKGRKDLTLNDIPEGKIKNDYIKIGIKYGYFQTFS
jgi:hypothetical protein